MHPCTLRSRCWVQNTPLVTVPYVPGAGCKTRLESSIQNLFPHSMYAAPTGLGKPSSFAPSATPGGKDFTRFSKSLLAVELGLEMYESGYDMACFWDNGDGGDTANNTGSLGSHMLMSTADTYRMNPMKYGITQIKMWARTVSHRSSFLK